MRRQYLIDARKAAGLSQGDVATRMGISQQAYSKYEAGAVRIDAGVAKRLADAIGCDPLFVLTGGVGRTTVAVVGVITSTESVRSTPQDQEELVEILPPPGALADELRLLRVDTDALAPRFKRGDLVIYSRDSDPHDLGECVACLEDGSLRIGYLERGAVDGTYTIRPYQAVLRLLQNQRLQWAAKVLGIWFQ